MPTTQLSHARSDVGVPCAASPNPAAHVRHGVQDALAALENVSGVHGEHTPLSSGAAYPAAHGVVVALPSHSWPAGHAAHSRSDEAPGAVDSYSDEAHTL